MKDLSVIIPARNEEFLQNTIDSVLEASTENTEVIAILDGYRPEISPDKRVKTIYYQRSIGQRAACNEGARISDAKFVMKLDAHCSLSTSFDKILMENCEHDWTVIPRMYVLDAFHWVCDNCGREYGQGPQKTSCDLKDWKTDKIIGCGGTNFTKKIVWKHKKQKRCDYMWIDRDLRMQYFDSNGYGPYVGDKNVEELKKIYNHQPREWARGDITDVMCGIGACWFMERSRYWELEGLDENHGSWGQMAVEIALKSWLSGGRQVVNKLAWFAHLPRTRPGFSFPYPNPPAAQEIARNYSRELWFNNKWSKQVYNLQWLINKFSPLPGWNQ